VTLPLRPNTELVTMAWLASIPGLCAEMVATTLPDVSKWPKDGFVVVTGGVGTTALDAPARAPVVQIDCFATNPSSSKPPWGRVDLLCEHIIAETRERDRAVRDLEITAGGDTYPPARVSGVRALTEPRRAYGDPADWAHKIFDLQLVWREIEATYS
jgi:hypothetical protein